MLFLIYFDINGLVQYPLTNIHWLLLDSLYLSYTLRMKSYTLLSIEKSKKQLPTFGHDWTHHLRKWTARPLFMLCRMGNWTTISINSLLANCVVNLCYSSWSGFLGIFLIVVASEEAHLLLLHVSQLWIVTAYVWHCSRTPQLRITHLSNGRWTAIEEARRMDMCLSEDPLLNCERIMSWTDWRVKWITCACGCSMWNSVNSSELSCTSVG